MSLTVVAAATALCCLLALATLARRFAWVRVVGYVSATGLSGLLCLLFWDVLDSEVEAISRILGVLAIVLASVTIALPVLHYMSDDRRWPVSVGTDRDTGLVRHCVTCGKPLEGSPQIDLACAGCGARFRVELLE